MDPRRGSAGPISPAPISPAPISWGRPRLPALPEPWSIRPAAATGADLALIHDWMNRPHLASTWKQPWSVETWSADLAAQLAGDRSTPVLVSDDVGPVAYLEIYWVERDRLSHYCEVQAEDLGVHIALGESARTGQGIGRFLLRAVAEGLLECYPASSRVLAEPDATNAPMLRAIGYAGYQRIGTVRLPHKTAALMAYHRRP